MNRNGQVVDEDALAASTYLYFAYGSNMSTARLTARTPSARVVGRGRLLAHALRWHKLGRDGSGKCDVVFAGKGSTAVVWGVLYRIDCAEKADLDRIEGLGVGYDEHEVVVATQVGEIGARTYRARPGAVDPALRPQRWYKAHVLDGAREHGLPAAYVAMIEGVETAP